MLHTYEEIRSVVLDILAHREGTRYPPTQYSHLELGVAEVFQRRGEQIRVGVLIGAGDPRLDPADADLTLEVFWNLFREGVITLGLNSANREFPWFRVSQFGKRLLKGDIGYFFLDVASFETLIREQVPSIDDTTMIYLKEAMQAFLTGCILSSSVMLGVASEHTFNLLVESALATPEHEMSFAPVAKERLALRRFSLFKSLLDSKVAMKLPPGIREDLDTHFAAILTVIRNFRNESGHPSGKIIAREQAYVLLNLFPSYCKKVYQLRDWLTQ